MADYADEIAQLDAIKASRAAAASNNLNATIDAEVKQLDAIKAARFIGPKDYSNELAQLDAVKAQRANQFFSIGDINQQVPRTPEELSIRNLQIQRASGMGPSETPGEPFRFRNLAPSSQTVQDALDVIGASAAGNPEFGGNLSPEKVVALAGEPSKPPGTAAKVIAGSVAGGLNVADTMTQPETIALMAAGGLPVIGRLINAGFLAEMIHQVPEVYQKVKDAFQRGDIRDEAEAVFDAITHGAFTVATAHGSVSGIEPSKIKQSVEDWVMGTPKPLREQAYNLNPATDVSQTETRNIPAPTIGEPNAITQGTQPSEPKYLGVQPGQNLPADIGQVREGGGGPPSSSGLPERGGVEQAKATETSGDLVKLADQIWEHGAAGLAMPSRQSVEEFLGRPLTDHEWEVIQRHHEAGAIHAKSTKVEPTQATAKEVVAQPSVAPFGLQLEDATGLIGVHSMPEASDLYRKLLDESGYGAGEAPRATIIDTTSGKAVARISYNGRLWDLAGKEIPQEGLKTAAQQNIEGWGLNALAPKQAEDSTGWTFKPEGGDFTAGIPPELAAQIPKKWEFTDRRKGSPTEGLTVYTPMGSDTPTIIKTINDKIKADRAAKAGGMEVAFGPVESTAQRAFRLSREFFRETGFDPVIHASGETVLVWKKTGEVYRAADFLNSDQFTPDEKARIREIIAANDAAIGLNREANAPPAAVRSNPDTRYDDIFSVPSPNFTDVLRAIKERDPVYSDLVDRLNKAGVNPSVSVVDVVRSNAGPELDTDGIYSSNDHNIQIIRNAPNVPQVMMHEAVHAGTLAALETNPKFRTEIQQLYDQAKASLEKPNHYAFTNLHEFVAEANTNPEFQKDLSILKAENQTLWSKFVGLVRKLFGLKDESVLERVMRVSAKEFSNKNYIDRVVEAQSRLRQPGQAKGIFEQKEQEKGGTGTQFIRTQQAAEPIAAEARPAIVLLRAVAATPIERTARTPEADVQRVQRDIAELVLGNRIVKTHLGAAVDGLKMSSDLLSGKIDTYDSLKRDPNVSWDVKSRAALDALHTFDDWDRSKNSFDLSYDRKIKALEDNLDQLKEGKDWTAYTKSTMDVLVQDVKDIGRSIVTSAGAAGGLKVFEDITKRPTALRNAVQFIANTADFNLLERGVITNTRDLLTHLSNEVAKTEPDKTIEQAAGVNDETLRFVADLVMKSEPLRQSLFEAQQFLKDKALQQPMGNFIKTISDYVSNGKYKEALNAFTTGVGKTAIEADKARRAAAFFAKGERDTIVKLEALKATKQLLDDLHNSQSVRGVRNSVYSDLGVRAIMHGLAGDTYILRGINPGEPDVTINFDSSAEAYADNLEKFQKYKEAAAEYLRDPTLPGYDPAKAAALREFIRQYDIYTNPSVSPEAGRLLHNVLTAIPRSFFGLIGGIDQIPNVVLRYGAGFAAEHANRTLNALSTAKEVGTASFYDHRHLIATSLRSALKSHGFTQKDLEDYRTKIWEPLVGSRQYLENIGVLEAGSPIGNGLTVTREDMALVKRIKDYEGAIIGKLTATDQRSYSTIQNFPHGVVEGQRVRLPAATGEDTINRRFGKIFSLVSKWGLADSEAAKIKLLNANFDKLVFGYMMDAGRASFNHGYNFPAEVRSIYNEGRSGNPVSSFEDLVNRITDRRNAVTEGPPLSAQEVTTTLLREFDELMGKLKAEQEVLSQKAKVKGFGGENSLNTPRGQQIAPSTWYDYGSLTDPEHIAYLNTATTKFYIDHLNAVEALHRALTEVVHKFENAQREQPNVNIHKTSVQNRISGKDYYGWDEAITAQRQVATYMDKLNIIHQAGLAAYEAGIRGTLGETAMDAVTASLLSGPQANVFNTFGGNFNIVLFDMALRNHAWYYSLARNLAIEGPRAVKELGNIILGNKLTAKIPMVGPVFKSIADYFSSMRELYDTGRRDAVITSKDLGKELASMWQFRDTGGSNLPKNPSQGLIGDLGKTFQTTVKMGSRMLKSATVMLVDSRLNMAMAFRQASELIRDMEQRAKRYGALRVRRAQQEGRDPYDPSDPNNLFSPEELSKSNWLIRGSTDLVTQASRIREFMRREADVNLDARMMDFYRRWSEATDADKPNITMLTDNERRQLGMATAAYGNLATFSTRPASTKTSKTARYAGLFLGYPAFQLPKLNATFDRFSKYYAAKGYAKALPLLIGTVLTAAIIGTTGVGVTEQIKRTTFGKYGNTPTIFDVHSPSDLPGILATGAAALWPFYGSMYNILSGNQFKRGFDVNSQFVFLNLATDASRWLKEMFQTGSVERPTIQFLRRWTFPANYLGGLIPEVSGLQDITNARNILSRAAKGTGMEQNLRKSSGASDQNFGPTTPLLNDFMNAVGHGNAAEIDSAFKSIVDYYVKQKQLPLAEATKRALASVSSRNPISAVFGTKITDGQLNELMARMSPSEKGMVNRVLGNFDAAINQVAGKHVAFTTDQSLAMRKVRTAKPPKTPLTLGQRALMRGSRARVARSPLSRVNRRLGIRVRPPKLAKQSRRIRPVGA